MIIDDDAQIRKLLERTLTSHRYEIETADNGFTALEKIATFRPDLVLLDIMMPGISGIEVCRRIRALDLAPDLKIFMLSAKEAQEDRRQAIAYGADDYISKPFHLEVLTRKIEHMLRKSHETAGPNTEA